MPAKEMFSVEFVSAWLLILSALVFLVGGMLYTSRAIWKWPVGQTRRYLIWERGFIIAAILVAVLGLNLLAGMLKTAGDNILAPSGMVLLLIGSAVVVLGETYSISRQEWIYAPIVAFVVLAFLAQALIGAGLLRTGLLSVWIGWATILWNLGWLVILPVVRPKDMYYPWLHYVAPLLIGIELLLRS